MLFQFIRTLSLHKEKTIIITTTLNSFMKPTHCHT